MGQESRGTLKNYFVTGARPKQSQFYDLLDSYQHKTDSFDIEGIIPSGGNIGIGRSPNVKFKLDVNGVTRTEGLQFNMDTREHLNFNVALYRNDGLCYLTVDKLYIRDSRAGSDKFYFDLNNGRLGINTMIPAVNLHVNGKIKSNNFRERKVAKNRISTNSDTYVDMAGMKITLSDIANPILVMFKVPTVISGAGRTRCSFRILVDDEEKAASHHYINNISGIFESEEVFLICLDTIDKGKHTIKGQWRMEEGDQVQACYYGSVSRHLIVIEL